MSIFNATIELIRGHLSQSFQLWLSVTCVLLTLFETLIQCLHKNREVDDEYEKSRNGTNSERSTCDWVLRVPAFV
jgi:hypothetical protein